MGRFVRTMCPDRERWRPGTGIRSISVVGSLGKGASLLVIENVPVISCPHCGASYMTAATLHELERIKSHRANLAVERPVPVAVFA